MSDKELREHAECAISDLTRLLSEAQQATEKIRQSEKLMGESYLRIRGLVNAFDTPYAPSAEQVYALTEAKVEAMAVRIARLEEACLIAIHDLNCGQATAEVRDIYNESHAQSLATIQADAIDMAREEAIKGKFNSWGKAYVLLGEYAYQLRDNAKSDGE